jgi:hypothetical protein
MYKVTHYSYCGMSYGQDFETAQDARAYAASRISVYRKRYPVTTLNRGISWEILEPDDAVMVPDACGKLEIKHITFECRECGSKHDTQNEALICCSDYQ